MHIRLSQNHMATTFHLTVSTSATRAMAAEQTLLECHRLIAQCEDELSEFRATSPVYRLNHASDVAAVPVGALTAELFARAETLRSETAGAFHYGVKGELTKNPPFVIEESSHEFYLRKLHPRAWLGFGAIGKGYALDKAREVLAREGFNDYCLNAGGSSILLGGLSAPDEPWKWGWSWMRNENGTPLGVEFVHGSGRPIAIGISGTQEKGNHLIRTHLTQNTEALALQSALVAASSGTEADALSTALFVRGWDGFTSLPVSQGRELSVAAIDSDGIPRWNGWFQRWWGALTSVVVFVAAFLTPVLVRAEEAVEAVAEEAIDLGDVAMESFNPYMFERDPIWILLPLTALVLVILHLKRPPKTYRTLERDK